MAMRGLARVAVLCLLLLPASALAQEATIVGTVMDSTGAVLPGVTITAVNAASGNTFVGVTDDRGGYRIPVRIGTYTLRAELAGFGTVNRPAVSALVGQNVAINFEMALSTVQESVTVTGQAALIDTTQSSLGSNIDSRQMESVPINGRNWMQLAMLTKGSRMNTQSDAPTALGGQGEFAFQFHVDGQQVTTTVAGGASWGQPRFSRDAIAEFEVVASRFDATQGRSSGLQVNAVTKSGTNTPQGSFGGYFRDDSMTAKDHVLNRVLPYSDAQFSTTFGGPIKRDRIHFFANYEYEREPQTYAFTTPYAAFNTMDLAGTRREQLFGGRVDAQLSPTRRLMVRGSGWIHDLPHDPRSSGGALFHASASNYINRWSGQGFASLTQTFGNRAVNETKGGWTRLNVDSGSVVPGAVRIALANGLNFGGQATTCGCPLKMWQPVYQVRNDFSMLLSRHQVKVGGELLLQHTYLNWIQPKWGFIDATAGPAPANLASFFPVWNDYTTWNLAALSPFTLRYQQRFGDPNIKDPRTTMAAWFQDDWRATERLTLNLGVRWDAGIGMLAEEIVLPPIKAGQNSELTNFAPRVGFAYRLGDKTSLRGGYGIYYSETSDQPTHFTRSQVQQVTAEIFNDGRPDFAANPFNGPAPTYEQLKAGQGGALLALSSFATDEFQVPYSHQASMGFQRQLGPSLALESDFVYLGQRRQQNTRNINLSYNPATQANNPFSNVALRPYPTWGTIVGQFSEGWANYRAVETALSKRYANRWQMSATYTLGWQYTGSPALLKTDQPLVPDLARQYSLGAGDQRHRVVLNGLVDLPFNFQMSGVYFYGSGDRYAVTCGCGDVRALGSGSTLLRRDGTMIPREGFVGEPIHRVDMRFQRRFPLGGRVSADGMLEVFNLFDHANYGSYVTTESNVRFRQPVQNTNIAYAPRMIQLGFRVRF